MRQQSRIVNGGVIMSIIKRTKKKKYCLWVAALLCVSLFSACGQAKKAPTPADFEKLVVENGFTVQDFTSQFEEGLVISAQMATGKIFQIEYYVLPGEEGATATFTQNKLTINEGQPEKSDERNIDEGSYSYYSVVVKKQYYVLVKIENAFVYVVAPEDAKQQVDELLQKLS